MKNNLRKSFFPRLFTYFSFSLILLSGDIEVNPGPSFYRGGNNSSTFVVNMPGHHPNPYISISALRPGGNSNTLTVSVPGLIYTDATGHASNTTMPFTPIDPFTNSLTVVVTGVMHWTITISSFNFVPTFLEPLPVTIPTTDPIAVTGTVSIANPIPSAFDTLTNLFKK